jgi:peptidoglycan/LPS O-acetylase OafA/YrhL
MLGYITFTVSMSSDAYRFLSAVFIGGVFWSIYPFDNVISNSGIFCLFKFLGSLSYSTYLLHIPLWPFIGMFIRNFVTLNYTISGPLILLPSILAASYLWHLFFERPDSISSVVYALLHPLNTIQIGIAKEIHGQTGYRAKEAYCAAVNN